MPDLVMILLLAAHTIKLEGSAPDPRLGKLRVRSGMKVRGACASLEGVYSVSI